MNTIARYIHQGLVGYPRRLAKLSDCAITLSGCAITHQKYLSDRCTAQLLLCALYEPSHAVKLVASVQVEDGFSVTAT